MNRQVGHLFLVVFLGTAMLFGCRDVESDIESDESAKRPGGKQVESDFVPYPPARRVLSAGDYELTVEAEDRWQTANAVARLMRHTEKGQAVSWERRLPQPYGPRFVFLFDSGHALFIDEWQNVNSRWALLLLDPGGEVALQRSLDDIVGLSGSNIAAFTENAHHGWWIESPPVADPQAGQAGIPTGAGLLRVDVRSAHLAFD